jgi:glc operon protein GlcG
MRSRLSLTADDAIVMLAACLAEAHAIGRNVSIAIVDDAGGLLAFQRMDGARVHTIDIAQRKARASAMVGVPTSLIEASQKDRPAASADFVTQGGLPAVHADQCAGAIGVSGGRGEDDEAIAKAGLEALQAAMGTP